MIYAQAGVWLRLAQIDDEAGFAEVVRDTRDFTDRPCQFDHYPDEDADALEALRY
jgi:hypothetical protein